MKKAKSYASQVQSFTAITKKLLVQELKRLEADITRVKYLKSVYWDRADKNKPETEEFYFKFKESSNRLKQLKSRKQKVVNAINFMS
jgi:adenylate kinase family enzyme